MLEETAALGDADVGAEHLARLVTEPTALCLGACLARPAVEEPRLGGHPSLAALGATAPVPRLGLERARDFLKDFRRELARGDVLRGGLFDVGPSCRHPFSTRCAPPASSESHRPQEEGVAVQPVGGNDSRKMLPRCVSAAAPCGNQVNGIIEHTPLWCPPGRDATTSGNFTTAPASHSSSTLRRATLSHLPATPSSGSNKHRRSTFLSPAKTTDAARGADARRSDKTARSSRKDSNS